MFVSLRLFIFWSHNDKWCNLKVLWENWNQLHRKRAIMLRCSNIYRNLEVGVLLAGHNLSISRAFIISRSLPSSLQQLLQTSFCKSSKAFRRKRSRFVSQLNSSLLSVVHVLLLNISSSLIIFSKTTSLIRGKLSCLPKRKSSSWSSSSSVLLVNVVENLPPLPSFRQFPPKKGTKQNFI